MCGRSSLPGGKLSKKEQSGLSPRKWAQVATRGWAFTFLLQGQTLGLQKKGRRRALNPSGSYGSFCSTLEIRNNRGLFLYSIINFKGDQKAAL